MAMDDVLTGVESAPAVKEIETGATDQPLLCHRLEKDNLPVVLRGAVADWPALARWDLINNPHARGYLQHLVGTAPVQLIMTRTGPHSAAIQSHPLESHAPPESQAQQQPSAYFDGALRKHERIAATFSDALALACASPLAAEAGASARGGGSGLAAATPVRGAAGSGAAGSGAAVSGAAVSGAIGSGAAGSSAAGSGDGKCNGGRGGEEGSEGRGGEEQGSGLQELIRAMASGAAPLAFYLAQNPIFDRQQPHQHFPLTPLLQDAPIASVLDPSRLTSANLWMTLGGPSSSSPHYDLFHNLLCIATGSKTVRLWPPSAAHLLDPMPLYSESSNHVHPHPPPLHLSPAAAAAAATVTLRAGDVLFLPEGWYHQVSSAPATIAINFWWPSLVCLSFGSHMDLYYARRVFTSLLEAHKECKAKRAATTGAGGEEGVGFGFEVLQTAEGVEGGEVGCSGKAGESAGPKVAFESTHTPLGGVEAGEGGYTGKVVKSAGEGRIRGEEEPAERGGREGDEEGREGEEEAEEGRRVEAKKGRQEAREDLSERERREQEEKGMEGEGDREAEAGMEEEATKGRREVKDASSERDKGEPDEKGMEGEGDREARMEEEAKKGRQELMEELSERERRAVETLVLAAAAAAAAEAPAGVFGCCDAAGAGKRRRALEAQEKQCRHKRQRGEDSREGWQKGAEEEVGEAAGEEESAEGEGSDEGEEKEEYKGRGAAAVVESVVAALPPASLRKVLVTMARAFPLSAHHLLHHALSPLSAFLITSRLDADAVPPALPSTAADASAAGAAGAGTGAGGGAGCDGAGAGAATVGTADPVGSGSGNDGGFFEQFYNALPDSAAAAAAILQGVEEYSRQSLKEVVHLVCAFD
ncbi:hypothetical protein CLOM_g7579 [Closterium sp. NIES-68]|nr:hypothetical protein CLOM_g7579 [Closterium sp. NIES-68]GJP71066.1 hypothetical protein CLOP_g1930 [Closterium sp. NIES-67]